MKRKRILVCPLNWGLGHATRCIPVIAALQEQGHEVLVGAEGAALQVLREAFPNVAFLNFPGYQISYPSGKNMAGKMLLAAPGLLWSVYREHRLLDQLVRENSIDVVISDNRYGAWNRHTQNIFITHQLFIKSPFAETLVNRINHWFIRKYDQCWVPDHSTGNNLSGELSHAASLPGTVVFIGPLSRFGKRTIQPEKRNDLLVILSGPEPQRSIFEKKIMEQLSGTTLKTVMLRGLVSGRKDPVQNGNITTIDHLPAAELEELILSSSLVLCRSGYSSIMDLAALGKKAIFVPTPGQTEQEYLARYFMEKQVCFSKAQDEFNLGEALEKSKSFTGFNRIEPAFCLSLPQI